MKEIISPERDTIKIENLQISLATFGDIDAIIRLNGKFQVEDPTLIERQHGFLKCEPFTTNDLELIIKNNEACAAFFDGTLIGYYIIDNYSNTAETKQDKLAIADLQNKGFISRDLKIATRTQIVVDKQFHGKGLSQKMLAFLKPILINKYDALFSVGLNSNPKKHAHVKAGWEIIHEDSEFFYVIYNLKAQNAN